MIFKDLQEKLYGPDGSIITKRNILGLIVVLFLLLTIPIGIYVVQQRTNLSPKAGGNPTMSIAGSRENPNDPNSPVITTDGNLSITLNPGGGTPGTAGGDTSTPTATARCAAIPLCNGATCNYEVQFYKNNQKQSSGYEIAWQPNIADAGTITGWLSLTTPNTKGEVATNSKVSHNYGNVASGPYTAKFNVRTSDGLFTSCQVRVLTPASTADGGTGADIGYDCSRSCNGRINAHVFEDANGNGKKDGGSDGENGVAGAKITIESTKNDRGEVKITKLTTGANGQALFECIPAIDNPDNTNDDFVGITYKATLTVPSGYSINESKRVIGVNNNQINLDSCSDTDVANFAVTKNN